MVMSGYYENGCQQAAIKMRLIQEPDDLPAGSSFEGKMLDNMSKIVEHI